MNHTLSINNKQGFTLMELLISFTLLGVILVIVFGAFQAGIGAWEKGEAGLEKQQRERIIYSRLKHQLASICQVPIKYENQKAFYLRGKSDFLEFTTTISMMHDNQSEKVYVIYRVVEEENSQKNLELFEKKAFFLSTRELSDYDRPENFYPLIEGMDQIRLEYLKPPENNMGSRWVEDWLPDDSSDELPAAIRIVLIENADAKPRRIIARLPIEIEEK